MLPNFDLTYYNVYFDIAAILIMAMFLVVYSLKNKLRTNLTKTFQWLLFFNFAASVMDMVTAYTIENAAFFYPWVNYLLNGIYLFLAAVIGYLFLIYSAVLVHRAKFVSGWGIRLAMLPLLIHVVLIVSTGWTGWVYTFTNEGSYTHGPLYMMIYYVQAFYILACYVFIIRFRKAITAVQHLIIIIFCLLITGGLVAQALVMPNVLISYLVTSIALVFMYMTLMMNDSYLHHDTGLLNDSAFYTVVSEKFEYEQDFFICMFKFREYHKCISIYGAHPVNTAMRLVQKRMRRVAGRSNVYHITDDYYAIIINGSISQMLLSRRENKINKLFDWMSQPIWIDSAKIELDPAQIKLCCPDDASDYDSFRSLTDYIVEKVWDASDERIIAVTDEIRKKFENERGVARALNEAIRNNSLQIYLQPIYSVEEKRIVSAEVLCRLIDKELGFIPPDVFIPVAEKMHMIQALGTQVFRKACVFAKESGIMGEYGIRTLKINLSPVQCNYSGTAEELIEIARSYNLKMSMLELELTESTANDGNQTIRSNMQKLKDAGARLALDDYGTGYSNLISIINLPFDYIKIDKSILWSYSKGENSILESVVPMMKKQGYKLVCEGVETEYQARLLSNMGCDYLQGYYYSKPIPKTDFVKFVEDFNGKY